ncbi:hypothetical protein L210DRAFT_2434891 [Boletus edulis BED1]|uniref:Uncharacterized protein n=1 Tax=Boletus edulis BED1 TaxID=1328754 RepID=A0AAD4GCW0_BOLED|nr:hypothetical protein L210DRAFT_2434891 [Boletus edulis BED1]
MTVLVECHSISISLAFLFLMSLATQFTEDVYAAEDTVCQRNCSRATIPSGQPRHYVVYFTHKLALMSHHLCYELGRNLFGEGNVESATAKFEIDHACNAFCRWPGGQVLD